MEVNTTLTGKDYREANQASVRRVLRGLGPDSPTAQPRAGVHVVFNMACAHIRKFCTESTKTPPDPKPYKNAYDHGHVSPMRVAVDKIVVAAVPAPGLQAADIYFGAVETQGTGVRFYGDMCLVLNENSTPSATSGTNSLFFLDRNSYDIVREPVTTRVAEEAARTGSSVDDVRMQFLASWRGTWEDDLATIAWDKVRAFLPAGARRWTTGQIAAAVLQDEDYIEVLYPRSFGTGQLLEVRVNALDAAAEADIAIREEAGELTTLQELEWREQRRDARRALAEAGVPVRIVTTHGRARG